MGRRRNPRRLDGLARLDRIAELAGRDGWVCHYCGCGLALGRPSTTIDEVVPLGRGGQAVAVNQVLACQPCNQRKADMTADEFAHFMAKGGPPRSYFDWRIELKQRHRVERAKQARADGAAARHGKPAVFTTRRTFPVSPQQ